MCTWVFLQIFTDRNKAFKLNYYKFLSFWNRSEVPFSLWFCTLNNCQKWDCLVTQNRNSVVTGEVKSGKSFVCVLVLLWRKYPRWRTGWAMSYSLWLRALVSWPVFWSGDTCVEWSSAYRRISAGMLRWQSPGQVCPYGGSCFCCYSCQWSVANG